MCTNSYHVNLRLCTQRDDRGFNVQVGWLSHKYVHGFVIEFIIYIKEWKSLLTFYKMTLLGVNFS